MKRMLITALILLSFMLLTGSSVNAQTEVEKGFKLGMSMSKLTGDDTGDDAKYRTGFIFGGYLGFEMSPGFSIQPELLYVMKGAKWEYTENIEGIDVDIEETFKLDYLEIPIAIKYSATGESSVKHNFYVGPAVSFLLSAKHKVEASAQGFSADAEEDVKDDFKSIDFGIFFGGGLEFDQGSYKILIDARFTLGMTDIPDGGDENIKHSNLAFMLGIGF